MPHSFLGIVCDWFCAPVAELSSCDRNHTRHCYWFTLLLSSIFIVTGSHCYTVVQLNGTVFHVLSPYHSILFFIASAYHLCQKQKKKENWTLNVVILRHSGLWIVFVKLKGKALCLFCSDTVPVLEKYILMLPEWVLIIFPTHRKAPVRKNGKVEMEYLIREFSSQK